MQCSIWLPLSPQTNTALEHRSSQTNIIPTRWAMVTSGPGEFPWKLLENCWNRDLLLPDRLMKRSRFESPGTLFFWKETNEQNTVIVPCPPSINKKRWLSPFPPCHVSLSNFFFQKSKAHHEAASESKVQYFGPWKIKAPKEMKVYWLVVEPTHLKNMLVKLDHLPR